MSAVVVHSTPCGLGLVCRYWGRDELILLGSPVGVAVIVVVVGHDGISKEEWRGEGG